MVKAKSIILLLRNFPSRTVSQLLFQSLLRQETFLRHFGRQPECGIRWREFRNKLQAFHAFEYADVRFQLHRRTSMSLPELIGEAERCQLSPFLIEGIAYHLTRSKLLAARPNSPAPVFENCAGLAPRSMVLLHTGLGLALAESVLHEMNEKSEDRALLVEKFAGLCRQYSQPGYAGVVFEALGLVARTLFPGLVVEIDRCLSTQATRLAYFWHGVGRGIYFAPENVSPRRSAPWKALTLCLQETSHELARQNAMAGLAWAITIINMNTPEVMQAFARHHGYIVLEDLAFMDGAGAAEGFCKSVSAQEKDHPAKLFSYRVVAKSI